MRSTPEVSSMGVVFSAHEDSVWSMLPPRTFSVGFEEQIVVGVMFFTFTDPKIVVKSLFPILYLNGRGVVKIWGLLFFGYSQSFSRRIIYNKSQKSKTDSIKK